MKVKLLFPGARWLVPWVPEVFFSLTSGEIGRSRAASAKGRRNERLAAFRAGHNREHKLQPETAQEKPLAPRVGGLPLWKRPADKGLKMSQKQTFNILTLLPRDIQCEIVYLGLASQSPESNES